MMDFNFYEEDEEKKNTPHGMTDKQAIIWTFAIIIIFLFLTGVGMFLLK